jgi:15-cis-phytoene synthase
MYNLFPSDLKACHARLHRGSSTFFAASLLLPRSIRDPAAALSAFCRIADDAAASSEETLAELRKRLVKIYAGQPAPIPEDRAFAWVVEQFDIPRALPEALLEGFEWDINNRAYNELDDLHAYSARVAGTVGAMMAIIMGTRDPALIARATELGMAMQLTNIARDVGEDARAGRIYLPRRWLLDAGIDPTSWLQSPCYSEPLGEIVQRLLAVADDLYARAGAGITKLPLTCRIGIRSAGSIYSEIGREIERRDLDSVNQRAFVSAGQKVKLIGRAVIGQQPPNDSLPLRVLEPARFLVDAVEACPRQEFNVPLLLPPAWWELNRKIVWTLDLFQKMYGRELSQSSHEIQLSQAFRSSLKMESSNNKP